MEMDLHLRARELLAEGGLPSAVPSLLWGGLGQGDACALCSQPIQRNEMQYEIEVKMERGAQCFRFHLPCHLAWWAECMQFRHGKDRPESTSQRSATGLKSPPAWP
jgi:hypothetical protein